MEKPQRFGSVFFLCYFYFYLIKKKKNSPREMSRDSERQFDPVTNRAASDERLKTTRSVTTVVPELVAFSVKFKKNPKNLQLTAAGVRVHSGKYTCR